MLFTLPKFYFKLISFQEKKKKKKKKKVIYTTCCREEKNPFCLDCFYHISTDPFVERPQSIFITFADKFNKDENTLT